tara:strand:+ start:5688 stop:6287 length:600 start_codon:yes stop_codon:yes gene_type:complete
MAMNGIVMIHGKEYKTVALRVYEFRGTHSIEEGWSIQSAIIYHDTDRCIVSATISHKNIVVGCGHAEEYRDASKINATSALEVAETSAIGRALASCGYAGTEYASANEVGSAIEEQTRTEKLESTCLSYADQISIVKEGIACEDYYQASATWFALPSEIKSIIFVAPSKNEAAPFSSEERRIMRTTEFREAKELQNGKV